MPDLSEYVDGPAVPADCDEPVACTCPSGVARCERPSAAAGAVEEIAGCLVMRWPGAGNRGEVRSAARDLCAATRRRVLVMDPDMVVEEFDAMVERAARRLAGEDRWDDPTGMDDGERGAWCGEVRDAFAAAFGTPSLPEEG